MRCSFRMGVVAAVLAVFVLMGAGCKAPRVAVPIDALRVPKSFDFSTVQDVTVKVTVTDDDGSVIPGSVVTVGNTGQELVGENILSRGSTNDQGQFEQVLRVPARHNALCVQALIYGTAYRTDATIENNEITVSFGSGS